MKVKIKVGFSATIQALNYHPIGCNDYLEVELEVAGDSELLMEYERFQKLIREKVIKNTIQGAKDFRAKRAELLSLFDDE